MRPCIYSFLLVPLVIFSRHNKELLMLTLNLNLDKKKLNLDFTDQ